jgi:mono/diheme cytochrome c family protein
MADLLRQQARGGIMKAVRIASTAVVLGTALVLWVAGHASGAKSFDGREIFRFDTFGDEQLWTNTLQLQDALATVTPATALRVGLKVDADALPPPVIEALSTHTLDVNDPRVTLRLLDLNAVVGVTAKVSGNQLQSVGITCAFCHSTVDDSLAPGIGRRLDGWPNRDLNVGEIVALSPVLDDELKTEFKKWGPGRYDARHHAFDGTRLFILNTPSMPTVIPPAFGLAGVGFETFTGDGPISYWNNYVGVTQMGGQGSFSDPRIGVEVAQKPDLVTPKLPALLEYQLSLRTPPPPSGTFDQAAAARGEEVFNGAARCSTCHVPPTYTDVLSGPDSSVPFLHAPSEIDADAAYAARSATGEYRTTPLRALWQHPPYFHDGSAADLGAVVDHYDAVFSLGLTGEQKADLVEFLKSL